MKILLKDSAKVEAVIARINSLYPIHGRESFEKFCVPNIKATIANGDPVILEAEFGWNGSCVESDLHYFTIRELMTDDEYHTTTTMKKLNGIILNGKVYEISVNTDPDVCERCALADRKGNACQAPHWLNCNCIMMHFSPSLTDKINDNDSTRTNQSPIRV